MEQFTAGPELFPCLKKILFFFQQWWSQDVCGAGAKGLKRAPQVFGEGVKKGKIATFCPQERQTRGHFTIIFNCAQVFKLGLGGKVGVATNEKLQ